MRNLFPWKVHKNLFMYKVYRCVLCSSFTYADRFQRWKLCPHCGATIDLRTTRVYLDVDSYSTAENVISQIEGYLAGKRKKDLSEREIELIELQYHQWLSESC